MEVVHNLHMRGGKKERKRPLLVGRPKPGLERSMAVASYKGKKGRVSSLAKKGGEGEVPT